MVPLALILNAGWSMWSWAGSITTGLFSLVVSRKFLENMAPLPDDLPAAQRVRKLFWTSFNATNWRVMKLLFYLYIGVLVTSFVFLIGDNDYVERVNTVGRELDACDYRARQGLPQSDECRKFEHWSRRWLGHEWAYALVFAFNNLQWCGTRSCYTLYASVPGEVIDLFLKPAMFALVGTLVILVLINYRKIKHFADDVAAQPPERRATEAARTLLDLSPTMYQEAPSPQASAAALAAPLEQSRSHQKTQ